MVMVIIIIIMNYRTLVVPSCSLLLAVPFCLFVVMILEWGLIDAHRYFLPPLSHPVMVYLSMCPSPVKMLWQNVGYAAHDLFSALSCCFAHTIFAVMTKCPYDRLLLYTTKL